MLGITCKALWMKWKMGPNSVPCLHVEDEVCGHLECVLAELARWLRLLVKAVKEERNAKP